MTGFPVLLGQDMAAQMVIQPVAYRLRENLTPLSTASITVLETVADLIPLRAFVRLYSPQGCAGVYRVVSRNTSAGMSAELTLQHGLCTLGDHMHPGQSEETSSCRVLLEKLLSNQDRWVLGTVDVPDDEQLTWTCNGTNDLQGLTDIMKELPGYYLDFDQNTTPWVLHVRKKPGDVRCEARMARNLIDAQIVEDTSEMCNVAYADGLDAPFVADTVGTWGRIERKVSAENDLPRGVLEKTVRRYLDTHKDPRFTITLAAVELSRLTGEPLDCFLLGTLCRCIIDGAETVQRIEAIDWRDPIGTPEDVVLTLSTTQKDMSVTVAGLVVDTRVRFEQMRSRLLIEAKELALLGEQIELKASQGDLDAAVLRLDAAEGSITAQGKKIDAQAEQIALKASNLRVDAIETTISGLVKVEDFESYTLKVFEKARIQNLDVEDLRCTTGSIRSITSETATITNGLSCGSLTIGGTDFSPSDYVTGASLSGTLSNYATKSWVIEKGYATSSDVALTLSGYVTTAEIANYPNNTHSHAVTVNEDGTVTLGEVSSSGGSFRIADTKTYKDGVSAAINSVTLSALGWQGGSNTVRASNGKELSVALPAFTASGGDSFTAAHKTTVYFYTASVQGYLASREVDASSVYDAGYQAAKDAYYDSRYQDGYDDGVLAGYDNGYAAGYQAARDAVRVEGGITSITNPAQGYYMAKGWAAAKLDGDQIDYTTFSKSQQFA